MTDEVDERLAKLTRATQNVLPSAKFTDRVMVAIQAEPKLEAGWWSDLPRASRRVLPALALAAAGCVVWAVHSSSDVDDAVVGAFDAVEIEW